LSTMSLVGTIFSKVVVLYKQAPANLALARAQWKAFKFPPLILRIATGLTFSGILFTGFRLTAREPVPFTDRKQLTDKRAALQFLMKMIPFQIEGPFLLATDPISVHVNSIGEKIIQLNPELQNYGHKWRFRVIDSEGTSATYLPDGQIFIPFGLLTKIPNNDDEIAALISTQIAHVIGGHMAENLFLPFAWSLRGLNFLSNFYPSDDPTLLYNLLKLTGLPTINYILKGNLIKEDHVFEADQISVKLLKKAGFDPRAVAHVNQKFSLLQTGEPIFPSRKERNQKLEPLLR